ncbi:MAG: LpqB family beta-propeller domain-containing protein [Sciscionella sp.]
MNRRSRLRLLAAVCGVAALGLAGCATVPNVSQPRVVPAAQGGNQSSQTSGPAKDADPWSLVRSFVQASADPHGDHAAAKAYLTAAAAQHWNPNKSVTVISDPFDTVPGPSPKDDPSTRTVILRGHGIGKLAADSGFRPDATDVEQQVHLRKQPNGQWRIVDPPPGVMITLPDFLRHYHQVRIYFYDQRLGIPVPDLRYAPVGPTDQVAGEVIDLLLSGPSQSLDGAVRSAIPPTAVNKSSVSQSGDGALLVNLAQLGNQGTDAKKRIAAQLVLSLQSVTNNVIRVQADGEPLFPDHPDWRANDVPSYDSTIVPQPDQPGLVATDGKLVSLTDGKPIPGTAGSGEDKVVTAGQSIDGTRLAVVSRTATGEELRVGRYGQAELPVGLSAGTFTRPTWGPGNAASGYEAWTVADGQKVYRVVDGAGWHALPVDASALTAIGPITDLRLSRDGVRVAAVIGGRLVVASVLRQDGKVVIADPQVLQGGLLTSVVGVGWQDQTTIVAATASSSTPVVKVPVDGLQVDRYDTANLTPPLVAITAAPGRQVVVVDSDGLWTALDVGEIWRPNPFNPGPGAIPIYPG